MCKSSKYRIQLQEGSVGEREDPFKKINSNENIKMYIYVN